MYAFETTRAGRIQLRVVSFLLSLFLATSLFAALWFANEFVRSPEGVSGFIVFIFVALSVWMFALYHRSFTSSTVGLCNEGVSYRALLGRPRLLRWDDIANVEIKGENRDLDVDSAPFYDTQLVLFRDLTEKHRSADTIFSRWPFRISVPVFVYADPEAVIAYITYQLYPEAFHEASSSSTDSAPVPETQRLLLDEIYKLEQSRHRSEKDARRVKNLSPKERANAYRIVRFFKHVSFLVGLLFLCCPLVIGFAMADMEEFLRWKALTLAIPIFLGMTALALSAQLAAQCTTLEPLEPSEPTCTIRDKIADSGDRHH